MQSQVLKNKHRVKKQFLQTENSPPYPPLIFQMTAP